MKLAPISAPKLAGQFQKGDYHMTVAPWLAVTEMHDYYSGAERPKGTFVILDNGAWEGKPMEAIDLVRLAILYDVDEAVLPDALGDGPATLKASGSALKTLLTVPKRPFSLMFVPHGQSEDEWLKCRDKWLLAWARSPYGSDPEVSLCIGMVNKRKGGSNVDRAALIANTATTGFPVHLLGIPNIARFAKVELPLAVEHGVRGVDSSIAFTSGVRNEVLTPTAHKWQMGELRYYDKLKYSCWPLIRLNTRILRHWCESGEATEYIPIELIWMTASRETEDRKVFESVTFALETCRVPVGRYAILADKERSVPIAVRPLGEGGAPTEDEALTVVTYV